MSLPTENFGRKGCAEDECDSQRCKIAEVGGPGVAAPDPLQQVNGVGGGQGVGQALQRRRHQGNWCEESGQAEHGVENDCADGLGKAGCGNDAGDEESDGENAAGGDEQGDGEREPWDMDAGREVAFAGQQHQGQGCGGEDEFDEHMGGEDGLRAERRGTQALENAAFAIDGDDGDQREHGADGDEKRHHGGKAGAGEPAGDA